ncbi:hypothetical protein BWP39_04725 [Paraburkholderia acidicola]|uniref:Uncharacterized protein n=1 Tax=Paraburkholderia acidicola TaxID=1912599 RepID=A0A2A4F3X5_9BURK|nr:hypothetical protein [Paraburkholderia acidicola]PCE27815.1 hypothetical protein BWP39_04725 [Paraburkholderia acidicola]
MSTSIHTPRAHSPLAALLPVLQALLGIAAASGAGIAAAQQVVNPGDIIVEREITPRSAFAHVPRDQDPVAVRATTFPANTFDPMMAQVVSDADLTTARGSSGLAPIGAMGDSIQGVTRILSGNVAGGNIPLGTGGAGLAGAGIGGTIAQSVTGALAPLSAALSGGLGGLK